MSDRRMNAPDSDESAREPLDREETSPIDNDDLNANTDGRQISNKSGKHSSALKLAASRPGFGPSAGANPVDGASGKADELGNPDDIAEGIEFAEEGKPIVNAGKNEYPASQRSPKR
ncbi:MAG TPA: hypothetical protein VH325_14210 [Bryobacteraceae bacterium]|nr:hypothetical protein [Bryobacteraceae bacterium]